MAEESSSPRERLKALQDRLERTGDSERDSGESSGQGTGRPGRILAAIRANRGRGENAPERQNRARDGDSEAPAARLAPETRELVLASLKGDEEALDGLDLEQANLPPRVRTLVARRKRDLEQKVGDDSSLDDIVKRRERLESRAGRLEALMEATTAELEQVRALEAHARSESGQDDAP